MSRIYLGRGQYTDAPEQAPPARPQADLSILDNNVATVLKLARGLSRFELEQLREAEYDGKTRVGVIDGLRRLLG